MSWLRSFTVAIDHKKYPFLADLEDYVSRRYGVYSLKTVLAFKHDILDAARRALIEAIKYGTADDIAASEDPVIVFYTALAAARFTGDRWVQSRYALAVAETTYKKLERETPQTMVALGRRIGLSSLEYHDPPYREPIAISGSTLLFRVYEVSVSFIDYVLWAKRLLGDERWKPVNLPVHRGRVFLERWRTARLLKEAVMEYVLELAQRYEFSDISDLVKPIVEEAEKEAGAQRRPMRRGGRVKLPPGMVVEEAFPPCMQVILEKARRGEHLSHHERFAIATFLLNIGADIEYVVSVFSNMPDFNEKITRYQVEHLAGQRGSMKKYRTYSCEKMKTLGLCTADCRSRSPVQEYYRRLRQMTVENEAAEEKRDG